MVSRGVNREIKSSITQRSVLSFVSSVVDPIGLVPPYTVRAQFLLKEIWRTHGQQWDDTSLLKNGEWPFKPSIEVLEKIRLAGPVWELNEDLEQASTFKTFFKNNPFYLHGQKSPAFVDSSECLPSCSD